MANQLITYSSKTKLDCSGCKTSNIILCLEEGIVGPLNCVDDGAETVPRTTLEAQIVQTEVFYKYGCKHYMYTIVYDDNFVEEEITCEDINGILCEGCLTSYIQSKAGDEVRIEEDGSGNQTFVSQHGCEYPLVGGAGAGARIPIGLLWGDGSDGDFTVLNGQDLEIPFPARNYFYENLTIDAGGILRTYGQWQTVDLDYRNKSFFQIYVAGVLTINGSINVDGTNGLTTVGRVASATIPRPIAQGGMGGAADGAGRGGNGQSLTVAAVNPNIGFFYWGGVGQGDNWAGGGIGGNGGAGGNGAPGYVIQTPSYYNPRSLGRFYVQLTDYNHSFSLIAHSIGGGAGGGGGGGGGRVGLALGGGGGGGAKAGASIYISAKNIIIGPTGSISAKGGIGGAAGNGTPTGAGTGQGSGGGGGGGGGGGLVYLVYETFTNNGIIDVTGGVGGAGGAPYNGGIVGVTGAIGANGNIYRLNALTGAYE